MMVQLSLPVSFSKSGRGTGKAGNKHNWKQNHHITKKRMKKIIILVISFLSVVTCGQAQLLVKNDGSGKIGNGTYCHNYFTNGHIGFNSSISMTGGKNIIGLQGCAFLDSPETSDKAIGVFGIAGNAENGHNMGVAGYLGGMKNGTAVFGSAFSDFGITISGMYAAYFYGNAYITHSLTVPTIVTPSDLRLKENVTSVSDSERNSRYLDRILNMNVIEYNYKMPYSSTKGKSSSTPIDIRSTLDHRHIGLAAQELQALFPNLVEEGQDGYLGVNYVELVPVLIRAIQELKQELDEVKGETKAKMHSFSSETTDLIADVTGNVLYQNTPNPFKEKTVIRFNLAENVKNASICIFDMTGKMLKKLPISSGMDSVSIGGYELGEGMFLYSLIVNGQEIDTKRMIITK